MKNIKIVEYELVDLDGELRYIFNFQELKEFFTGVTPGALRKCIQRGSVIMLGHEAFQAIKIEYSMDDED